MEFNYKCYSKCFVNKQNIRSYTDIVKYSQLKNENFTKFLYNIYLEKCVVDKVKSSTKLVYIMAMVRNNIRKNCQDDFKSYFVPRQELIHIDKQEIYCGCNKLLSNIIPQDIIGNNHNDKIFKMIIHSIIYSMKGEYINLSTFTRRWDFNTSPWNQFLENENHQILFCFMEWIIKNVLAAAISLNFYVTTCRIDSDERKLYFFYKSQWQRYYDKSVSNLVITKIISKRIDYCSGKLIRKTFTQSELLNMKKINREIPKLHLILKKNNKFRPIVRYKLENHLETNRIKERLMFLRKLSPNNAAKIEEKFTYFHRQWLKDKPKLYFIKADLTNAFGSINRQLLLKIVGDSFAKLINQESDLNVRKRTVQKYSDLISELKKPMLIRCGSTVYEWKRGLVQGYRYSPPLSEIYYNYLDNLYLTEILVKSKSAVHFFVRVVDDYLFITESINHAHSFLNALSKYKNINYEKTVVNFPHPSIQFSEVISFLGYFYNTFNLQVSRAEYVYSGQICYKIAFSSAVGNLQKFLESRIGQSSISITGHLFNFIYNDEELVWKHVFLTLCLSANKFCTILAILCDQNDMYKYLNLYKKRVTVKLCNTIIRILMQNKGQDFKFYYCINHFRYLSFKALLLCVKYTSKCNHLVPFVKDYLAKSDCIFGKWRPHSSRIDVDGMCQQEAVREICRKVEYKNVVKSFVTLPDMFNCYNKKSRM